MLRELRSAARDMEWIGTGFYDNEYMKVGDQWKFASRRFTSIRLPTLSPVKTSN